MQKIPYSLYLFCLLIVSSISLSGQNNPLLEEYERFRSDSILRHASWSFVVKDLTSGETLISHDGKRSLTPASIQKVITTTTAMMLLGNGYQYQTLLQHDGHLEDGGTLRGNLYIRGSGDPTFASTLLDDSLGLQVVLVRWVEVLKDMGVEYISGNIIGDDGIFDSEMVPRRWLWEHIGNYFGAGSSGLSVNENEYTVFFDAGSTIGSRATVSGVDPNIPGMSFTNEVTTGSRSSGDQVYIFGAPFEKNRRLTGTVPLGARNFPVRGSMADPTQFAADALKEALENSGIRVSGKSLPLREVEPHRQVSNRITLIQWDSPPLFDIIYRTNMHSVNTYAENLLKTIGYETNGEGSVQSGLSAMETFWNSRGVNMDGVSMFDGSGLSPSNRLNAEQMVQILEVAASDPAFVVLHQSLPLAGYSGSLTNHFVGSASEGLLRAKSGFLSGSVAYAGYTPMQNGHLAAFTIIVNQYEGSAANIRQSIFRLLDGITRSGAHTK